MDKERSSRTWGWGFMVLGALLLGLLVGKGVEKTGYASESYEELKIFAEVLTQVKQHYVETLQTQDLVHGAVRGLLKTLDPHSSYMTPEMYREIQVETKGAFGGLGVQIGIKDHRITVIAPIEGTPAHEAGIKAGDVISTVDGAPMADLTLMEAVQRMRGPKGTRVTITVAREGAPEPLTFTVIRDIIKIHSVRSRVIDDRIGYVRISQFQEATPNDLGRELATLREKGIRGLIVDLRNNPGGLLSAAVGVSDQFLDDDILVVSIKGRDGLEDEYRTRLATESSDYPLIILVNHGSASASEIVAAAMQDWEKAVIVGTTTFGKGSVQTILPLSDGSGLRLTTAKYYTPSGKSIHDIGVQPDIVVEARKPDAVNQNADVASINDRSDGDHAASQKDRETALMAQDTQLQKAIELIKTWNVFRDLKSL